MVPDPAPLSLVGSPAHPRPVRDRRPSPRTASPPSARTGWPLAPDVLLIVLLAVVAVTVAAPGLARSLWRDEAATASAAARTPDRLADLLGNVDGGLAGYYWLMHAWQSVAGHGEVALRLPSLVAAGAAVVLAGLLARMIAGRVAGVGAAVAAALDPDLVHVYGGEARPYALATALVAGAGLAAVAVTRTRELRRVPLLLLLWCAAAGSAVLLHLLALLAVLPTAVWLVRSRGLRGVRLVPVVLVPVLAGAAPALAAVGTAGLQAWIAPVTPGAVYAVTANVLTRGTVLAGTALALLVVLAVLARRLPHRPTPRPPAAGAAPAGTGPGRADLLVLSLWALGPILVLAVASWLVRPLLSSRYVLPSHPAVHVLVGLGAAAAVMLLRSVRGRRAVLAAGVLIVALGAVAFAGRNIADIRANRPVPEDLRAASERIASDARPGDRLLYAPTWGEAGMRWYLGEDTGEPSPVTDLTARPGADAGDAGSLWTPTVPATVPAPRLLRGVDRVYEVTYPGQSWAPVPDRGAAVAGWLHRCWARGPVLTVSPRVTVWTRPAAAGARLGCTVPPR